MMAAWWMERHNAEECQVEPKCLLRGIADVFYVFMVIYHLSSSLLPYNLRGITLNFVFFIIAKNAEI